MVINRCCGLVAWRASRWCSKLRCFTRTPSWLLYSRSACVIPSSSLRGEGHVCHCLSNGALVSESCLGVIWELSGCCLSLVWESVVAWSTISVLIFISLLSLLVCQFSFLHFCLSSMPDWFMSCQESSWNTCRSVCFPPFSHSPLSVSFLFLSLLLTCSLISLFSLEDGWWGTTACFNKFYKDWKT